MDKKTDGLTGLAPRRKSAGYTQETFADALGIKRSLLAAWEVGRVWPSARWLPEMAALLRCPVEELFHPPDDGKRAAEGGGPYEDILPREEDCAPCRATAEICTITQDGLPV